MTRGPAFVPAGSVALPAGILAIAVASATSRPAQRRFRSRTQRLRAAGGFRSAMRRIPARIEALGFVDVRQLLALGEQTGLTAEVLRPVRAAAAVIEREKDDTTAELFFEIP
jgi:hypothetical protein